jgi:hypothetical protein
MDDTARKVDAACISGDKEQVCLEGVKVTGTQRLYVYFDATTGDGTKGCEFTFDAATNRVWVKNTVNGQFMTGQWGSADFNSNDHAASGIDYAARNIASAGGTIYSNSHSSGMDICNGQPACFAGGANPDAVQGGSKFSYKGPAGSLTRIQVENHLSSGL